MFGHPRRTWVFWKLQGLQYYFPENFRCNLTYYESKNFTDSFLHHILESESFRLPFFYEKYNNLWSEMWKIKLQKIVGNLLDKPRKLYMNAWDGRHLEIFSHLQVIENFRLHVLLRTDIFQKTVVGCPWVKSLFPCETKKSVDVFIYAA